MRRKLWPLYLALSALAFFSLAPLLVLAFNSLKTKAESGRSGFAPPLDPVFSNFPDAWRLGNLDVTMRNSAIITLGTVVGVCLISGLAAYGLTRMRMRVAPAIVIYLFVVSSVPVQLFLVPLFFLWVKVHLVNSLLGLVIIYWALYSPFATLLLRSYLQSLPTEFEDAARVDGATELQVLRHVVTPLAWPGLTAAALVAGLSAWNEFFFAVTFIQDDGLKPISTSFLAFQSQYTRDWGLTSAAALFMVVPVILLFLLLQRRFIEGLTAGGLRG